MYIFDLHCDVLMHCAKPNYSFAANNGHISGENLKKGKYMAQCCAIYIPAKFKGRKALSYYKSQYELFIKSVSMTNLLGFANTKSDIEQNFQNNQVSCILTCENAEFLNNDLKNLNLLESSCIKILGLIHEGENCLAFPNSFDTKIDLLNLKKFGKEVVDSLNNSNIFIDVSHLNYGGFKDVISLSKKPVIATHSACRDLYNHPRNLYDTQIKAIANTGGIVGITYYSRHLNGTNMTEISDIIRHLKHLINIGGENIAALGSDFDGIDCVLPFKNCGEIQILKKSLVREFGINLAEKICYKNALSIFCSSN